MLFQNECLSAGRLLFVCALLFVGGCNESSVPSPENYELGKPEKAELSSALNEISGICYNAADSTLLAICDSKRNVFQLDLEHHRAQDYTGDVVPPDSDVEDVTKVDNTLYLLLSRGAIAEVPDKAKDTTGVKIYSLNIEGVNDFESIYYDPTAKGLVILCKSCLHEDDQGIRTAYRFDLQTKTFDPAPFYTFNRSKVNDLLKNDAIKFAPSAAAIHPFNKRLYILSGTSNLLVIADNRGDVTEAYELDPFDFSKAEGIAFAPNGDMYISNETKSGLPPTLLRFPYKEARKKK